jgi:hypothetical protein
MSAAPTRSIELTSRRPIHDNHSADPSMARRATSHRQPHSTTSNGETTGESATLLDSQASFIEARRTTGARPNASFSSAGMQKP